jgi:hypothetical protein
LFALLFALAAVSATASTASPARAATPAEPRWVYQMINDFNLGISAPSAILATSYTNYTECAKNPPDWPYVDGNTVSVENEVQTAFAPYGKLIPGWIAQIAKLKRSPTTALARAKLVAAEGLHANELAAWQDAVVAVKAHRCGSFLDYLKKAQRAGAPDWADQYSAVNAIAMLYGSHSASDQTPYAQKLG